MSLQQQIDDYKRREIITHRQDLQPREPIAVVDALVMETVCYIDLYDKAGRKYCQVICKPKDYDAWMGLLTEPVDTGEGQNVTIKEQA